MHAHLLQKAMLTVEKGRRLFKREIRPAFDITRDGRCRGFYIKIEFTEGGRLSLYGCWNGTSGQNHRELLDESLIPADGFEYSDLLKIKKIWERWHLNDMKAGTPRQEEFIRNWCLTHEYDYANALLALSEAGLLVDNGYRYGNSWLKEEVPEDIIRYLFSLPAVSGNTWNDIKPAQISESELFAILSA